MDIMELGAIGELVGGLAVIGSLIYVGMQVRQSNQLNRAESVRSFVRDHVALLREAGDPAFTDVLRRASVDFDGLSKTDQTRVHVWLLSQCWLSFGNNLVDPQRKSPFTSISDGVTAHLVRAPGFSQWWNTSKPLIGALAQEYVDRIDDLSPSQPDLHEFSPWFAPDETVESLGGVESAPTEPRA